MIVLKKPTMERYGMCYSPHLTDECKKLIEQAQEKISPFAKKEISRTVVYFKWKGEELGSEYDCCDSKECIKSVKKEIREQYGKGIHLEECWSDNDADHESIETCNFCGIPLNEYLTWCQDDLSYLEENRPWSAQFFKDEAFVINCILESTPTMDWSISGYHKHQGGEILKKALEDREVFFQRIVNLAQAVVEAKFIEAPNEKTL